MLGDNTTDTTTVDNTAASAAPPPSSTRGEASPEVRSAALACVLAAAVNHPAVLERHLPAVAAMLASCMQARAGGLSASINRQARNTAALPTFRHAVALMGTLATALEGEGGHKAGGRVSSEGARTVLSTVCSAMASAATNGPTRAKWQGLAVKLAEVLLR
jgi:hypothetical protein